MTDLQAHNAAHALATPDAFFVLWQDPESRAFHTVGELSLLGGRYRFSYSPRANRVPGFTGLTEFPEWNQIYTSDTLFPTFANRVMTPRRDDYVAYLASLGITTPAPEPFEVLARTLGASPTDHLHVLPHPVMMPNGSMSLQFPAHGCRHVDPDGDRLREIVRGDALYFAREPHNTFNALAVLIGQEPGIDRARAIGYVPDVLAPLITRMIEAEVPMVIAAAHVSLPDPALPLQPPRLLVRVDAVLPHNFEWVALNASSS